MIILISLDEMACIKRNFKPGILLKVKKRLGISWPVLAADGTPAHPKSIWVDHIFPNTIIMNLAEPQYEIHRSGVDSLKMFFLWNEKIVWWHCLAVPTPYLEILPSKSIS